MRAVEVEVAVEEEVRVEVAVEEEVEVEVAVEEGLLVHAERDRYATTRSPAP